MFACRPAILARFESTCFRELTTSTVSCSIIVTSNCRCKVVSVGVKDLEEQVDKKNALVEGRLKTV